MSAKHSWITSILRALQPIIVARNWNLDFTTILSSIFRILIKCSLTISWPELQSQQLNLNGITHIQLWLDISIAG